MKTKIFSLIALISVSILLTGCTPKKDDNNDTSTKVGAKEESLNGSLLDIVKLGKNVQCSFNIDDESGKTNAVTYVSGGKARSDFTIESETGQSFESHTIADADWVYIWNNQTAQGTKMKVSELPENDEVNNIPDQESVGKFNEDFDYKCSPWIPDGSKFDIPTNIEFTDFTEMMKSFQEEADKLKEGLQGMCGTCEMVGDADKVAECKQNLGCE